MKLKRFMSLLASMVLALTALTGSMTVLVANAANYSWFIDADGVLVISGEGEMKKNLEHLISWGFTDQANGITEVIFEDGITIAGEGLFTTGVPTKKFAFTTVTFPPSLTNFNGCFSPNPTLYPNLKDIYVYSKNVTDASTIYNSKLDGTGCDWHGIRIIWHIYEGSNTEISLRNDLKLTDENIVYIPDDEEMPPVENKEEVLYAPVTETSGPAGRASKYEWDESSKTLTFSGKGAITIPDYYYKKYKEVAEHLVIESGIKIINAQIALADNGTVSAGAFYEFTALKDIELPDTLIQIGESTFRRCLSLEGELDLPDSLMNIGLSAFAQTNITSINSLNEGMFIGGKAFYRCSSLKEVTIPKNAVFGNEYSPNGNGYSSCAFDGCTSLERAIIYDGIFGYEKPFRSMLRNCPSLKDVYLYIADLQNIGGPKDYAEDNHMFSKDNNITFHIYRRSITETTLRDVGYLKDATDKTEANYVYFPDLTPLKEAIDVARGIDTSLYTDETASAFNEALETGIAILNDLDATQNEVKQAAKAINNAILALKEKSDEPPSSDTSSEPSSDKSNPTTPTTSSSTKATRSPVQVTKDKNNAQKTMNQVKITSLKAKGKKKKIVVSWKKVTKAVGYEVQVAKNNKFKKAIVDKFTMNKKIIIKNLKSRKTYYVRVRAYATYKDANNKPQKVYSKWINKARKVKVK